MRAVSPLRDTARVTPEESTTHDLVQRQKRLTDAANRRDLDAMMAFYAPDGVYDMSPTALCMRSSAAGRPPIAVPASRPSSWRIRTAVMNARCVPPLCIPCHTTVRAG